MRLPLALLALAPFLLAGCGEDGVGPGAAPPAVEVVGMHNRMYDPAALTITQGTTLRFEAHDALHTADATDGQHGTGDVPQGESRDIVGLPAGEYVFACKYHSGMRMTVVVQEE